MINRTVILEYVYPAIIFRRCNKRTLNSRTLIMFIMLINVFDEKKTSKEH